MKKFSFLLVSLYLAIMSPLLSLESLGIGLASGLVPLLKPIVEETVLDAVKHIKAVVTGATCPYLCTGGLPCGNHAMLSSCKQTCQKIEAIGGYELRIRFGQNWSLTKCVRKGVMAKHQTPQGKKNTKSIAVYSQKDLDNLLELISLQMTARKIVDTGGSQLTNKQLAKQGKTREEIVEESTKLIEHIEAAIKKNVEDGIYGNQ